jgi:hypothetical protein
MAPRKYKQIGYMGGTPGKKPPTRRPQVKRSDLGTPRVPDPLKARLSFKCALCGNAQMIAGEVTPADACTNCGAPIHSCVNCRFFDSSAPNECTQPIEHPIDAKRALNSCPLFRPKITVDISVSDENKHVDARAAFDALFKK